MLWSRMVWNSVSLTSAKSFPGQRGWTWPTCRRRTCWSKFQMQPILMSMWTMISRGRCCCKWSDVSDAFLIFWLLLSAEDTSVTTISFGEIAVIVNIPLTFVVLAHYVIHFISCLWTFSYRQAQATVLEALPLLNKHGISTKRPDDYFAEMAKSDQHMQKVSHFVMLTGGQKIWPHQFWEKHMSRFL